MKTKNLLISIITSSLLVSSLHASSIFWTGGTAGDASGTWDGTASTFNGQAYTSADDLTLDGSATKMITLAGTITTPDSLTVSGTGTTGNTITSGAGNPGAGAITLSGSSIGGTLSKTGTADLVLASADTFGAVTISSGKFFLNNAAGLGTTGTLTVNSGAASGVTGSYGTGNMGLFFYDSSNINASYAFSKNITFGTVSSATTYAMAMRGGQNLTTTLSGNISGGSNVTLWLDTSTSSDGGSIWALSGDNSGFAGVIRLNRGRLFLNSATAGGTGALFIQSNGNTAGNLVFGFAGTLNNTQITMNSGSGTPNYISTQGFNDTISGNIISTSAGWGKAGTGTLTLTNATNGTTTPITVAAGTLSIGSAGRLNSGSFASTIALSTAISVFDYSSTASQTLSGVISGSGAITKSAVSTLTLGGNNTYSGGTTVYGGTIRVSTNDTALGAGAFVATSAIANASASITLATANGGGARTLANNIAINDNGTGTTTLSLDGGYAALTLNGVISGNGNLLGASSGTVILEGNNTYTGTTTTSGSGTLQLASAKALGSTTGATVTSGGTLDLNGQTIGAIALTTSGPGVGSNGALINSSAATASLSGNVTLAGSTTVGAGNIILSGSISGVTSSVLTKMGSGTLTFAGNDNATGNTVVNGGALLVSGAISGSTAVVNSGGTFGGTGAMQAPVTIQSGGSLLGGDGVTAAGGLNLSSNVTLQGGSTIVLTLGPLGTHSSLIRMGSSGVWTFATNQSFSFIDAQVGTYDNIISGLSGSETNLITGGSTAWNYSDSNFAYNFSYDNAGSVDLNVLAIPEPSTAVSLLGGLGILGLFHRRRRR